MFRSCFSFGTSWCRDRNPVNSQTVESEVQDFRIRNGGFLKNGSFREGTSINQSGQIIIFHQAEIAGDFPSSTTFWGEVAWGRYNLTRINPSIHQSIHPSIHQSCCNIGRFGPCLWTISARHPNFVTGGVGLPSQKLTAGFYPWKLMEDKPFRLGRPIFRGELLVLGRVYPWIQFQDWCMRIPDNNIHLFV